MTGSYPKTLAAIQTRERSGYEIARALWDEVEKTERGNARQGEIERVRAFLSKNSAGDTYSQSYLSDLHALGGWIIAQRDNPPMPPRMAMEARSQKLSLGEAIDLWNDGGPWTLRSWAESLGHRWEDVQAETVDQAVDDLIEEYGLDVVVDTVLDESAKRRPPAEIVRPEPSFDAVVDEINEIVERLLDLASQVALGIADDESLQVWGSETAQQLRAVADHLDPHSVEVGR